MQNTNLTKCFLIRSTILHVMPKKSKSISNTKQEKSSVKDESPISLDKSKNILIAILAKPGARQNAITDLSSEGVGVQINAPPTDGEANAELIKYFASVLNLRKSDIALARGFKSRNKLLKVTGEVTSIEDVHRKILNQINS